ncbi:hypothetical protein NDU88_000935 [Pleurodeles waltl]|uniref:Uncharacterized protein n=1 Tax=Pleurodeles waltl TaxID=8319 RepID=A0AAV7UUL2_PLEWA|nr:hypothetical protein NDU88_000935 [Pleurodeles waltl]
MACSPPCISKTASQVRRGGRAKGGPGGKGAAWAGRGAGKVGPAWGGPKGNPRQAERSRHQLVERGGVLRNELGAACSARPDSVRGGGKGRSSWEPKRSACQQSWNSAEAGDGHEKGLGEGPRGEEIVEESSREVLAVPEEVSTVGQPAEVEVRRDRGAQAQKKDSMVPI